jgi:hypothetical protein
LAASGCCYLVRKGPYLVDGGILQRKGCLLLLLLLFSLPVITVGSMLISISTLISLLVAQQALG